jgi:hypothetical protein
MKLGLLSDIHAQAYHLQAALDRLHADHVDQIVVLGDVTDTFGRGFGIAATCELLAEAKAVGVWGNHDYGLCIDPSDTVCDRYPESVFEFMRTLRPRLEVEGCLFTHVEPWLNTEYLPDLWYGNGPPENSEQLDRIFSAVSNRVIFSGHYHSWLVATPAELKSWDGSQPISLNQGRFFVVINALSEGHFATYDTAICELVPFHTSQKNALHPL